MSALQKIIDLFATIFNLGLILFCIGLGCGVALLFFAAGRGHPISILIGLFAGSVVGVWLYNKCKPRGF